MSITGLSGVNPLLPSSVAGGQRTQDANRAQQSQRAQEVQRTGEKMTARTMGEDSGLGENDGVDERDADGRMPWQRSDTDENAGDQPPRDGTTPPPSSTAYRPHHPVDPTGITGQRLDVDA